MSFQSIQSLLQIPTEILFLFPSQFQDWPIPFEKKIFFGSHIDFRQLAINLWMGRRHLWFAFQSISSAVWELLVAIYKKLYQLPPQFFDNPTMSGGVTKSVERLYRMGYREILFWQNSIVFVWLDGSRANEINHWAQDCKDGIFSIAQIRRRVVWR